MKQARNAGDDSQRRAQRRGRLIFLAIGAVFAVPVLTSYLVYFVFPEVIPQDRTHQGELVHPAQPTENLQLMDPAGEPARLTRRWSLLLVDDGHCAAECARNLLLTRQVRLSLNERMGRVQRVLLVPADADIEGLEALLRDAHPDLRILRDAGHGSAQDFFGGERALHLLDPLGNHVMRYRDGLEPAELRKDIVRLLRASQIG